MPSNQNASDSCCHALLDFIDRSPTPFHATENLRRLLGEKGFVELEEAEPWNLAPGGRYQVVRNGSSLLAFSVGTRAPSETGFKIVGAHTDSPNLRLKPNPAYPNVGYVQLGVEVYGGVLLATWTDRDLSLAGRVVLRGATGFPETRLLQIEKPLLRIPQLAIHLNRNVNDTGLILNKQTHMPPILQMASEEIQCEEVVKDLVAQELGCAPEAILNLDLSLYDVQKSAFGGPSGEFLFAPRLDNLASCHAAVLGLLGAPQEEPATRVLVFFDNEEVGSDSAQGGGSPFLRYALERMVQDENRSREVWMRALARSLFISADMAHAVHPNYADMHDARHMPVLNGGPVIKSNVSQRYATEGVTAAWFQLLCERAEVPVQNFVIRSDLACGSTIGPITAANLGIRTVDVGNPMLAMHSIREMAGSRDHPCMVRVFQEFFSPRETGSGQVRG